VAMLARTKVRTASSRKAVGSGRSGIGRGVMPAGYSALGRPAATRRGEISGSRSTTSS
jgi:hypothetical protein